MLSRLLNTPDLGRMRPGGENLASATMGVLPPLLWISLQPPSSFPGIQVKAGCRSCPSPRCMSSCLSRSPFPPAGFRARAWRLLTACCVMFRTLRKFYGTLTSRQTSHQSKQLGRHTRPHTYKAPTFQPLAHVKVL